jgi:hypothetical protein
MARGRKAKNSRDQEELKPCENEIVRTLGRCDFGPLLTRSEFHDVFAERYTEYNRRTLNRTLKNMTEKGLLELTLAYEPSGDNGDGPEVSMMAYMLTPKGLEAFNAPSRKPAA